MATPEASVIIRTFNEEKLSTVDWSGTQIFGYHEDLSCFESGSDCGLKHFLIEGYRLNVFIHVVKAVKPKIIFA